MKAFIALVLVLCCVTVSEARGFRRWGGSNVMSLPPGHTNRTAQDVANALAAVERMGHFGGNPGLEGCGAGMSPQDAYNRCCYNWLPTVDVGYAQGKSGTWYCCRRY